MSNHDADDGGDGWVGDLAAAVGFLTRLPVAGRQRDGSLADAAWAFPPVGAAIGMTGGAAFAVAAFLGLPPWPAAVAVLAATVLLTGALHEDGLADTADGLGGGTDRRTKLAIMRDSRIGTFGVIALVLALLARAAAIAALAAPGAVFAGLIAAGALSRGAIVALMHFGTPARPDGLGASAGQPAQGVMLAALGLAALIAGLALGVAPAAVALAASLAAALGLQAIAARQIGGYTGDVLGAAQQLAEIATLYTAVALMP